ncbi:efflux RND transporter periplasmic adaptor subunit [Rubrivivax gelatinosus]|uniref:Efflux transporter periplasmic adaptor subunit n=1 Tax=Rubrivivax gelatinosus TaxID=28068 RepID=A0ABS1DR55_RUBGE|nr:efflux RND transporter periplasmic adaptor subunit [Rubrivivax gelatinosus]MBK1711665.1 efflux transporter periplasmic adaptor subunit [Rubrivivax gelatinosus]
MSFLSTYSRRPGPLALTALVAALGLGGAALLATHDAGAEAAATAMPAMPVSVAAVLQQDVAPWSAFSGRLEAVEHVELRARVSGTVLASHFREGALVKAGELLFSIDPAPYAAEVERAQAQVLAAQARLNYTRSELERAKRLWDEQAIAQRELDERDNAAREAEANQRAAQAALQSAKLNLGYTQVRAPVSGRVGRREVTVGNLVAAGPGAPVLTTLVSVNPIYASFDADEATVTRALAGLPGGGQRQIERLPVLLGSGEGARTGRLQLVDNQVDARSGTVRLRAVFDNADGVLMPGQFAELQLGQVRKASALLVDERAVGTDQNKRYVWVVGADHKAAYREVKLGAAVGGLRVVSSGLKAGEQIVVNGLQRVRPGAEVAPQVVPMGATADTPARS